MKYSALALTVLSILLIAGCKGTPKGADKTKETERDQISVLTIDTLTFEAHTPLYEGASNGFDMSMNIEWPKTAKNEAVLENMQKHISGLLFGSKLATTDIEFAMNAYNSMAANLYIETNSMEEEYYEEYPDYVMNWIEDKNGKFLESYNGMVSYMSYVYGYSGGAHGMDILNCITLDKETGDIINYEDLFIEGYEERLIESLRANLLCSIDDMEMLFEKDILPHQNFYLTSTGITYIYQRYEIGPYVLGIIEVTIPWKEIQDIIR